MNPGWLLAVTGSLQAIRAGHPCSQACCLCLPACAVTCTLAHLPTCLAVGDHNQILAAWVAQKAAAAAAESPTSAGSGSGSGAYPHQGYIYPGSPGAWRSPSNAVEAMFLDWNSCLSRQGSSALGPPSRCGGAVGSLLWLSRVAAFFFVSKRVLGVLYGCCGLLRDRPWGARGRIYPGRCSGVVGLVLWLRVVEFCLGSRTVLGLRLACLGVLRVMCPCMCPVQATMAVLCPMDASWGSHMCFRY